MEALRVVVDTCILINMFDRAGELHLRALQHVRGIGMDGILVSAITEMELIKGVRDREHERQLVKKLKGVSTIPIDPDMSARATALLYAYHLSHGLDTSDAIVAATAIEMGFPLFTYNTKDFRFIDGLELYIP